MRQSVESEYNMQGLGQLLQLYGGAAAETEYEYKHLSEQFKDISERRKEENNRERREKMKRQLHKLKSEMGAAQEKIAGYSRSAMQMLNEADQKLDKLAIEGVSKFKEADRKFDEYVKNSVDSLVGRMGSITRDFGRSGPSESSSMFGSPSRRSGPSVSSSVFGSPSRRTQDSIPMSPPRYDSDSGTFDLPSRYT